MTNEEAKELKEKLKDNVIWVTTIGKHKKHYKGIYKVLEIGTASKNGTKFTWISIQECEDKTWEITGNCLAFKLHKITPIK